MIHKLETMKLTLENYKKILDTGVVKRGVDYSRKGNVASYSETGNGKYSAVVSGTEDYHVSLTMRDGTISSIKCSCPYDMSSVCKHAVALIHAIENAGSPATDSQKNKSTSALEKKKKTENSSTVKDILEKIPAAELSAYIEKQSAEDSSFKHKIMSDFHHLQDNNSISFYKKELQAVLRDAKARKGFIEWNNAIYVANFAHGLVQTAEESGKRNNYTDAIHIYLAIFETMIPALQYADDSNGDIGGPIKTAMDLFTEISQNPDVSSEVKKEALKNILRLFDKKLFSGWDWNTESLAAAAGFASSESDAENVFKRLEACKNSDFDKERAQMIGYDLLIKMNRQSEADTLLAKNLYYSSFREKAIDLALVEKNYAQAEKLSFDGINHDQKDRPGLVCNWHDRLLQISELKKDTEKTVKYARELYLSAINPSRDYYAILKNNIPKNEWAVYVNGLIFELRQSKLWFKADLIPQIYISEKRWNDLLDYVEHNTSFQRLERYEKYLKKEFSSKLADLYEKCIITETPLKTGRPFYKLICRYLRRMQKLGAHDKTAKLAEKLRTDYSNRKALIEELMEF